MKVHLLDEHDDFALDVAPPLFHEDVVQDLELATVLDAMAAGDDFVLDIATTVMLASLSEPNAIRYRQRVLADCVAHPDVARTLYSVATEALAARRDFWGYSSRDPRSVLSAAVNRLEGFVTCLKELRRIVDEHGDDFASPGLRALCATLQAELDDEYFTVIDEHLDELRFRHGELISMELAADNSGTSFVLRSGQVVSGWKQRLGIAPRSSYSFTLPPRDDAGIDILADMAGRGVNEVANAVAQSADHIASYFTVLRAELAFYVSCLNLHERLALKGAQVVFPDVVSQGRATLSFSDLRDVALTVRSDRPVVGNDVNADGKDLLIVTGANSGGKSTFLRSVGQAQLMAQCGMYVVAGSYETRVRAGVFTHFIREEDRTMTSGRLDEELGRMSRIADELRPHSMMLFNESFAATREHEGSEIGRQVVHALLDADTTVVFVTHQYDFADSFRHQNAPSTLFLRAERGEAKRRAFKLVVADPLPTSFGEDLYEAVGGWLAEEATAPNVRLRDTS